MHAMLTDLSPVTRRPVNEGKNYGPIFDFNYRQCEYQNIII